MDVNSSRPMVAVRCPARSSHGLRVLHYRSLHEPYLGDSDGRPNQHGCRAPKLSPRDSIIEGKFGRNIWSRRRLEFVLQSCRWLAGYRVSFVVGCYLGGARSPAVTLGVRLRMPHSSALDQRTLCHGPFLCCRRSFSAKLPCNSRGAESSGEKSGRKHIICGGHGGSK